MQNRRDLRKGTKRFYRLYCHQQLFYDIEQTDVTIGIYARYYHIIPIFDFNEFGNRQA